MKTNPNPPADTARLRCRAEARLKRRRPEDRAQRTELETARLVHELQVHQIELEMQNEELQQTRAQGDALLAQYTDLYDFAPTGYLTVKPDSTIRQVNLTAASLLGTERTRLLKHRFARFVTTADRSAFAALLTRAFASKTPEVGEVRLSVKGKPPATVPLRAWVSEDEQECREGLGW